MTLRIAAEAIVEGAARAYRRSMTSLPIDVMEALREAESREQEPVARRMLGVIIANAEEAERRGTVVCQDTGIPEFRVALGTSVEVEGDPVAHIRAAVARITREVPLVPHVVHPISRENGGDNLGLMVPMVDYDLIPGGDYMDITSFPVSGVCVEAPVKHMVGIDAMRQFLLETVQRAGAGCPPFIIGVGIGGSYDYAMRLAKWAAARRLDIPHPNPMVAAMEDSWLEAVNGLGMGIGNLHGSITALGVNVEMASSHTACTPVAIRTECWAMRRATIRLYPDGRLEDLF